MNPMTNVKNIKKLSELELKRNLKTSWHDQYKKSAWIFVGGLPYDLTEGDIICVFSQYGEVVNINLVRDKANGNSKGFCFLCYEDQRSTVLAVDNFNGIKLLGRTLRVDHVQDYKPPKDSEKKDAEMRRLQEEGCAPGTILHREDIKKEKQEDDECLIIEKPPTEIGPASVKPDKETRPDGKSKKKKKEKKASKVKVKKEKDSDKKKKKKRKKSVSSSDSSEDSSSTSSDSDSDSTESSSEDSDSSSENKRTKKRNHKQTKRKKAKHHQKENAKEGDSTASLKRKQLEEKIKALEKALNTVRSARKEK